MPFALDVLSDIVLRPAFAADDVEREKKVVLEEIKMVEDTPDDLVHELFTQHFWDGHPLGRPILGTPGTVEGFSAEALREYFATVYAARNLIVAAAGNLEHSRIRELTGSTFGSLPLDGEVVSEVAPPFSAQLLVRNKDLEQSHLCVGAPGYPQNHVDRYVGYLMNTMLGGSMSSRLFQNIREKRGLAYAVFSGLSAYRDAGMFNVYAGCSTESVPEVLDLVVEELRGMRDRPVAETELRRAKDHLKGNLMLSLESTSSRMTHLARQDIYFDQPLTLDETLAGIERVTADDVQRVATDLFQNGRLAATALGPLDGVEISPSRLSLQ